MPQQLERETLSDNYFVRFKTTAHNCYFGSSKPKTANAHQHLHLYNVIYDV